MRLRASNKTVILRPAGPKDLRFFGLRPQNDVLLLGALNEMGKIVKQAWDDLPNRFDYIQLNTYQIMPNHFHGIIHLLNSSVTNSNVGAGFPRPVNKPATPTSRNILQGAGTAPLQRYPLGRIVAYFKYKSTKQINAVRNSPGLPIWQRNYYEHVIRVES